MNILSRFRFEGENGYRVQDRDQQYAILERGLYIEENIRLLKEEGYKFLGYNGNILSPEGILIKNLAEEPCIESQEVMLQLLDEAECALTEDEAAEHFDRGVELEAIEFRPSTNEIKTREALIEYLQQCRTCRRMGIPVDVRPLNSFVAKEALFTADELVTDKMVRRYFDMMAERRKFSDYQEYMQLVNFLRKEGLLPEGKVTVDDIMKAYTAWGICGLKSPVVDSSVRLDVSANIFSTTEAADEAGHIATRAPVICLFDKDQQLYYGDEVEDYSDIESLEAASTTPCSPTTYNKLKLSTKRWGYPYVALPCLVENSRMRMYYEIISESGVSFKVKIDSPQISIAMAGTNSYQGTFLLIRCIDGSYDSLDICESEETFKRKNLLLAKAYDLVRKNTMPVPVKSSIDLYMKEGVNPYAALGYATTRISNEKELNTDYDYGFSLDDSANLYLADVESQLLEKFNPKGQDYETQDELIEILCATRDEMIEKATYLNEEGVLGMELRVVRPIEQLEFASMFLKGQLSIDHLHMGKKHDAKKEFKQIADFLGLVVSKMENNKSFEENLANVENNGIVDLNTVILQYDAEYRGYLRDKAQLNHDRIKQSVEQVCIQQVFREISNMPVDKQRHYAFSAIVFDTHARSEGREILMSLIESVEAAIQAEIATRGYMSQSDMATMLLHAPEVAINIIFSLAYKKLKINHVDDKHLVKIQLDKESNTSIEVDIDSRYAYLDFMQMMEYKYCTLSDWCMTELASNRAFSWYCINANITPWRVTPKGWFTIKDFNFTINYLLDATISRFSDKFREGLRLAGSNIDEISQHFLGDNYLVDGYSRRDVPYTDTELEYMCFRQDEDEVMDEYFKRFSNNRNAARNEGKHLLAVPLRADRVFEHFASVCEEEPVLSTIVEDGISDEDKNYLLLHEPRKLTDVLDAPQISSSTNRVTKFSVATEPFEDVMRWTKLLDGTFQKRGLSAVMGDNIIITTEKGQVVRELSKMTNADASVLASKDIFYALSDRTYLIPMGAESLKLEVN